MGMDKLSPHIQLAQDHLTVQFEGLGAAAHMRRSIVIPFSTMTRVDVGAPEWPPLVRAWRVGTHLPGITARGTFVGWQGRRTFYSIDRRTKEALTMHLREHPDFDEVTLDVPDPRGTLQRIEEHRKRA